MARNHDTRSQHEEAAANPYEGGGGRATVPPDREHDTAAQERLEFVGWDEV